MKSVLSLVVLVHVVAGQVQDQVVQLLVYPEGNTRYGGYPPVRQAYPRPGYTQSNTRCSMLEQILTNILNEKKKKLRSLLGQKRRPFRYNNNPPYINTYPSIPTYSQVTIPTTVQPTTPPTVQPTTPPPTETTPTIHVMPGIVPYNPPQPVYMSRPVPPVNTYNTYKDYTHHQQPPRSLNQIFRDVASAKRNILRKLVGKKPIRSSTSPRYPAFHPATRIPPSYNSYSKHS